MFAVKEINNGTAAVVREEYGDKKIGFSLSFEGYLRVPADGSYLFQLEIRTADSFIYAGTSG